MNYSVGMGNFEHLHAPFVYLMLYYELRPRAWARMWAWTWAWAWEWEWITIENCLIDVY